MIAKGSSFLKEWFNIQNFKSVGFVLNLIGTICSTFLIVWSGCNKIFPYFGMGIALLCDSILNFSSYFKNKKACKEESASAKLNNQGE